MFRQELIFVPAIVTVGLLDWLTTVTGILFRGATEANPLLSGITGTSLLLFSVLKISAVLVTGFLFYKAPDLIRRKTSICQSLKKLLYGAYVLTFFALTVVVAHNVVTLLVR